MPIIASAIPPALPRSRLRWWLLVAALDWGIEPRLSAQVLLSVDDPQMVEGDTGTSQLTFTLHLSEPAADVVSVNFYTAGFSATAGVDFLSWSGIVAVMDG